VYNNVYINLLISSFPRQFLRSAPAEAQRETDRGWAVTESALMLGVLLQWLERDRPLLLTRPAPATVT